MSFETPLMPVQTLSMIYNLSGQTGAVEAPMVVDISELLVSIGAIQVQEASDRTKLSVLLHETRDTLRPQMFEWAAAGFTPIYIVQKFELNPPSICSDGIQRNTLSYIEYLLGKDISQIIADIQALCLGVTISYSVSGNTLNIHVSRA
jgi:hypothetical protein